jgi:hypothetical protein
MGLVRIRSAAVCFLLIVAFSGRSQTTALKFIENKNQWPATIDFAARTPGGRLMISSGQFSLYLFDQEKFNAHDHRHHGPVSEADGTIESGDDIQGHHVAIRFAGSNPFSRPQAFQKSEEYYNFFLGSDSSTWASRAYAYDEVVYSSLYKGVDLKISSVSQHLKYDFIVQPGADPAVIQVEVAGADEVYLEHGHLIIQTSVGYLTEKKPYTYQVMDGVPCEVKSEFILDGNCLSFYFPDGYDECLELVIDPLLIFSTFSGSTADNWGSTATPGENGTLYSSGIANQLNAGGTFPATTGAFQTTYGGNYDIAIIKYDSIGSKMLYASFLGGSSNDSPHSLVMDERSKDLIVLGTTSSFNFPVTNGAHHISFNGGQNTAVSVFPYPNGSDIILSRINSTGDKLLASTYLGGSGNDGLSPPASPLVRNYGDELRGDVITDTLGNVYISSVTNSANFPTAASFNNVYRGGSSDAIVVKMTPQLTNIVWAAFIGGSNYDAAHSIKFDSAYAIYVAGGTNSTNFMATAGAYQQTLAGGVDGWIAKITNDGSVMEAATYTGTSNFDQVYFVDLNVDGDVYVYGQTNGNFPVTPGVYNNPNSGQFVQKFLGDLTTLEFSTVFGSGIGIPNISPTAFLVNDCNNLYMAGWGGNINSNYGFWASTTNNMPVTPDALQKTTSGDDFYFMVLTGDARELLYGTYLGGNQTQVHVDGGTSRFDRKGIVYHAVCAGCNGGLDDFPTTPGAWSRTNNSGNCNNAAFKFDLSSLRARLQTNTVNFKTPGIDKVCFPEPIRFQNLSTGGETFEWDLGDGTILTLSDTNSFVHQYPDEGTYLVKLKAIDLNTCASVDSAFKLISVFRNDMNVQDDDAMCFGTGYQLKASGGTVYEWRTADGPIASTQVNPEVTTTYFVTITDANGCTLEDEVNLEVIPGMDLKMEYEFKTDCFSRPELLVRNATEAASDEATWVDFGDGSTSDLPEIVHTYDQDGDYTVRILGSKAFCVYELPVTLPIYTLLVPNVITPEGSPGLNDRLIIQYGEKGRTPNDAGIQLGLKVFNRWGNPVYESANYQSDWAATDLDAGVYYYTVSLGSYVVCKSWVQVLK